MVSLKSTTKSKSLVSKKKTQKAVVTGVEMFRKQLDEGLAGENVVSFFVVFNVMKSNVDKLLLKQVQSTHTLNSKAKSTSLLKKKVDVTLHSSTTTVHNSTSVLLTLQVSIELPAGTEMVMPGDNVTIDVELIHPIAVEQGTTFLYP